MSYQYRIVKLEMPSEWPLDLELEELWERLRVNHSEIMNKLGQDGWEYFMHIGPLFYFKRVVKL